MFDNDGFDDLVINVWNEGISSFESAGAVHLFLGSSGGLTATGNQFWHLNSTGFPGECQAYTWFGEYMLTRDFNNDNYADLVVGVPFADVDGITNAGALYFIPGCSSGLTTTGSREWVASSPGIDNDLVKSGHFGSVIVSGNFNNLPGTGRPDLAIGYFNATVNNLAKAGEVYILFGTSGSGFAANRILKSNRYITLGIPGTATANEKFGLRLESGNYDSLAYEDLMIKNAASEQAFLYGYNFGMSGNPF